MLRLEAIISGESLFNDGVGVVLFTIGLAVVKGVQQPTASGAFFLFAREVLGGVGLGLVVVHSVSWSHFAIIATAAIMVCLVARAVSVYVVIAPLNRAGILNANWWGLTQLLTWGGLRGGLALALALSLPDSPKKATIVNMTYAVVIFSILAQGATIRRLFPLKFLDRIMRST